MLSWLLFAATSLAPKLKADISLDYGKSGGINDLPALLERINQNNEKDTTITITLYSDLVFTEELKFRCNLEFKPDSASNNRNVSWVFGNPDIDLLNTGELTFSDVNIIPVVPSGSTSVILYGNIVNMNAKLVVPEGVTSLKGMFASFSSDRDSAMIFDEITYTYSNIIIAEWPTKNIVFNQRIGSKTSLTIQRAKFEIELGYDFVQLKKDSQTITINMKISAISTESNNEMELIIDNCEFSIIQTSDNPRCRLEISELFNSTITLAGEKITHFYTFNINNMKNSYINISTDLPDEYLNMKDNMTFTKSVKLDILSSNGHDIKNPTDKDITIVTNSFTINNALTVDPKIKIETKELSISASNNYNINASITVKEKLNLEIEQEVTITDLHLSNDCIIASSGRGYLNASKIAMSNNPKVFYYKSIYDFEDKFPLQISQARLNKLSKILCSPSTIGSPVQAFINDYRSSHNFFSSKNDIFDIGLDTTQKCIGVKFNKYVNPKLTIHVGGTDQVINEIGSYRFESLNSADWNIQPNITVQSIEIKLFEEPKESLSLDSLNIENLKLRLRGEYDQVKVNLSLSQSVMNKLKEFEISNLEIEETGPISWDFNGHLDLQTIKLSEEALNSFDFNKIERVSMKEQQTNEYLTVLPKIKYLVVYLDDCDEITFKETMIEIKKTGSSTRNIVAKSNTVILQTKSSNSITLKHLQNSTLTNVHLANNYYNIVFVLGDDWGDSPHLSPICYGGGYYTIDVTNNPNVYFYIDPFSSYGTTPLFSSSSEIIKMFFKAERNGYIVISSSNTDGNKIKEIQLNGVSHFENIKIDKNSNPFLLSADQIETEKIPYEKIKMFLDPKYFDPGFFEYFQTLSPDYVRYIVGTDEDNTFEVGQVNKLTLSRFTEISSIVEPKVKEIEVMIHTDSIMPYIEFASEFANETQFSFIAVESESGEKLKDIDERLVNNEFRVTNIMGKKCEDLKPFSINSGKSSLSVRCANEDTGSYYHFENAVVYAKMDVSEGLSAGAIAGITVGTIAGAGIIVVIILFATGIIACRKKEDSTEEENERGAAEV